MVAYFIRAVLGSANDAALLEGLGCGDFLASLSSTQKSVQVQPLGAYRGTCGFTPLPGHADLRGQGWYWYV